MNDRLFDEIDVSRETMQRLVAFQDLIVKWNPTINLVAKSTIADIWDRHIRDSVQFLCQSNSTPQHWVDLGSGGGLPGIVVSILLSEKSPDTIVTFIESDTRKCVFLRNVIRELSLNAKVENSRIEQTPPQNADVISARALADLTTLLELAERHAAPDTELIFAKGRSWQNEVAIAQKTWRFDLDVYKSKTEENAAILRIKGLYRD